MNSTESGNHDIWIHDLTRSTKTRLTFEDQSEAFAAWSQSGRQIYCRQLGSRNRIMRRAADGAGQPTIVVETANGLSAPECSRDGRFLVYYEITAETQRDIRYVDLRPDGTASEPITFVGSPADELVPKLSPDGRYLAYVSDESGRTEIYVRPFPNGAGRRQASVNGGTEPRWRSDGRELYYIESSTLMAVSVSSESALVLGKPVPLFEAPDLASIGLYGGYDVTADGQRFLTIEPVEGDAAAPPKIRIVENWYEEFRDRQE